MSNNPNVQAAFRGETPNVEINVNRTGPAVGMIPDRTVKNVSFTIERGGRTFGVIIKTTEEWNSTPVYRPNRGDVLVYSDHGQIDDGYGNMIDVPGVKIGDGDAYLIDLPFVGADVRYELLTELNLHKNNNEIHVTAEDRTFWNNKLNYTINNGNLTFNRN